MDAYESFKKENAARLSIEASYSKDDLAKYIFNHQQEKIDKRDVLIKKMYACIKNGVRSRMTVASFPWRKKAAIFIESGVVERVMGK